MSEIDLFKNYSFEFGILETIRLVILYMIKQNCEKKKKETMYAISKSLCLNNHRQVDIA